MSAKIFADELHKPVVKNFERRSVYALYPNMLWSIDLVDMSNVKGKNQNITFLLNVIDVYSRYAFSVPLKSKSAIDVLQALKSIGKVPNNMWADDGKEFFNKDVIKWCNDNNINLYSTHSGFKSVFVERFNRTMKENFYKYFTEHNHTKYLKYLPKFINIYNNTVHRSTKEKPIDLYNEIKESQENIKIKKNIKTKLKVGDYVRLSKVKRTFEKGYTEKWTREVFKIVSIDKNDNPIMYSVEDLNGEIIEGKFYTQELQKTNIPLYKEKEKEPELEKDKYIIDKLLKRFKKKNRIYFKVSWKGYKESTDELRSDLMKDVPELIVLVIYS